LINLTSPTLLFEYAIIDSIGRNKGWHLGSPLRSLDELPKRIKELQVKHPKKTIKTKVYEYTLAFGSKQIA
jgi:hypothetical protein